METKQCSKCGEVKGVGEYGKDKSKKHGIREQCKKCWNEKRRRVHSKSEGQKQSMDKWKKKEAKKPLRKNDKRLIRVSFRVKAHFKRKYKKPQYTKIDQYIKDYSNAIRINGTINKVNAFGYKILSEFNSIKDYTLVRCEKGHERQAQISNIIAGTGGCNECRLSSMRDKIKKVCDDQGAELLEPYVNNREKILIRCKNGHELKRFAKTILNGNECCLCAGNSVNETKDKLKRVLCKLNITLVGDVVNMHTKIKFMCNKHKKLFYKTPITVISSIDSPCDICKGRDIESRRNKILNKLKKSGYVDIDLSEYVNRNSYIKVACQKGHKNIVLASSPGCIDCSRLSQVGGYHYPLFHKNIKTQNIKAVFYQFSFELKGRFYKMVGVSKNWKGRLVSYRGYGVKPFDISLTKMSLYDAYIHEQEILNRDELQDVRMLEGLGFGGSTECFDVTDVGLFHPVHSI